MEAFSLYQLNSAVRDVLDLSFPDSVWVTGELSEARQAGNGHFYGELIEKSADGNNVIARARINCWARQYNLLKLRFHHETGQDIRAGLNVMLLVQVTYHEAFGLSLNVVDIDAIYTTGSMVLKRKEILRRLMEDGILHDNQTLPLPALVQRVAVVSAANAAGYGDFCRHLEQNEHRLRFTTRLFPAVMQGEHVEESVLAALQQIAEQAGQWDVVVIIRGGGAVADLADFDSYHLAACIAQFSLPVVVGIGHERDETVLDHVAHRRAKTPTAAADFLIDHQLQQLVSLVRLSERLQNAAHEIVSECHAALQRMAYRLPSAVGQYTLSHHHRIQLAEARIKSCARNIIQQASYASERLVLRLPVAVRHAVECQSHRIGLLAQKVVQYDPNRILCQGYSLTTVNGTVVTDASQVKSGDVIHTRLAKGEIISICHETESKT